MALTEQEVLSDASGGVTEIVASLGELDLTFEQRMKTMQDNANVLSMMAKIIEQMIKDKLPRKGDTIH